MDIEQQQDASRNEDGSEHEPESIHVQRKVLASCLGTERDDTHPEETYTPANVGKKSDADPDEEQTPTGCVDHRSRDTSRWQGWILLTPVPIPLRSLYARRSGRRRVRQHPYWTNFASKSRMRPH